MKHVDNKILIISSIDHSLKKKLKTDGVWQTEFDHIYWVDISTGFLCKIQRNSLGSLCGYVSIPFRDNLPDEDTLEVHGGITYFKKDDVLFDISLEKEAELKDKYGITIPKSSVTYGFDCAHYNDYSPLQHLILGEPQHYKSVNFVTKEIEKLSKQLTNLTTINILKSINDIRTEIGL